jgi:NADH:ubiquinone oxidoreductase subunit 3 (subunit A)
MAVNLILTPPIAFLLYIPLVLVIVWVGQRLAGPGKPNPAKTSVYGSGEQPPTVAAAPGYQPFFLIALFFAILHLGILVLGTTNLTWGSPVIYLIGLLLALAALVLG